jgi:hypothetical protein
MFLGGKQEDWGGVGEWGCEGERGGDGLLHGREVGIFRSLFKG